MKRTFIIILLSIGITQLFADPYRLYQVSNSRYGSTMFSNNAPYSVGVAGPSTYSGAALPSFQFGSHAMTFGRTYIPQSTIYTPFGNESPSIRRAPGGGHSGGTDITRPGLPVGNALVPLLLMMLIYLITKILCNTKRFAQQ